MSRLPPSFAASAPAAPGGTLYRLPMLRGVNLFGNERARGATTWPTTAGVAYYLSKGFNCFRVTTLWENFDTNHGGVISNTANLARLEALVAQIASAGGFVIIDCHESFRWGPVNYSDGGVGAIVGTAISGVSPTGTVAAFASWWGAMAAVFAGNPRVIFEIANEPHDMDTNVLVGGYNSVIAAIRATGAGNLILIDGNDYTSAAGWTQAYTDASTNGPNSVAMLNVVDGSNNLAFDIHQYVDGQGGTTGNAFCNVSAGVLGSAIAWARANNKKLFLGEFGVGLPIAAGLSEVGMMIDAVEANPDVFLGWTMWGAFAGQGFYNASGVGSSPATTLFNLDPYPASEINATTAVADFSGATPDDARTTFAWRYTTARTAFSIDGLGGAKIIAHLNPYFGISVSQWTDSTGNGNNFTQGATGSQPTLDSANGGLKFTGALSMASALNACASNAVVATGSINGVTMTISAMTSGTFTIGMAVGGELGGYAIQPGTCIVSQSSGVTGGAGVYVLNNAVALLGGTGGGAIYGSGAASIYNIYAVVFVPTLYYSAGARNITNGSVNGLNIRTDNAGNTYIVNLGVANIGPNNAQLAGAQLAAFRKQLIAYRSSPSGQSALLSGNGAAEIVGDSNGFTAGPISGSGVLQIGPAATGDAFTLCELVIANNTLLTTQDHQKIVGALCAAHGIPQPAGSIYGYTGPLG